MKKQQPKILILVGPPGSGKSTFARYFLRTESNWNRVCRDDFRAMQFEGTRGSDRNEILITYAIEGAIEALLLRKSNVLIDATHCKKEYIMNYVERFGHLADIEFKVFDITLEELEIRCEARELNSGKFIPKDVIKKMYNELQQLKTHFDFKPIPRKELQFKHLEQESTKPSCFLFDLDGTLADANGRNMFNPKPEEVMKDIPIQAVIRVVQSLRTNHEIIFVSGREATNYDSTYEWLIQHVFGGEQLKLNLFMRAEGDYRRDSIIKKEILHEHILPYYNVIAAFDDRLQVIRECWNKENIFCFNVNQYLEEF